MFSDIDAEKAVLGSVVIDGYVFKNVSFLKPQDFSLPDHQVIWSAMSDMARDNTPIDYITLGNYMDKLKSHPPHTYLNELSMAVPTSLDAEHYARIVKEHSRHNQAIKYAEQGDYVSLEKVLKDTATASKLFTGSDIADDMISLQSIEAYRPIPYGYEQLDASTTGMHKGSLIVVGARPSMGKSQLLLEIWLHALSIGKRALFISLEMSRVFVAERLLAIMGGIGTKDLRTGQLNMDKIGAIADASGRVSEYDLGLICSASSTSDIRATVSKMGGVDLVLVDYLQMLKDCSDSSKGDNPTQRVGYASKQLKSISLEYDIPLVIASQLSRAVEARADKHPMLSDLRDSGEIEQDADVVLLLYREDYYSNNNAGTLEIARAKDRQMGAGRPVTLYWDASKFRYNNK